jgi:hypothetical protein
MLRVSFRFGNTATAFIASSFMPMPLDRPSIVGIA